jgi:hypothetical protein
MDEAIIVLATLTALFTIDQIGELVHRFTEHVLKSGCTVTYFDTWVQCKGSQKLSWFWENVGGGRGAWSATVRRRRGVKPISVAKIDERQWVRLGGDVQRDYRPMHARNWDGESRTDDYFYNYIYVGGEGLYVPPHPNVPIALARRFVCLIGHIELIAVAMTANAREAFGMRDGRLFGPVDWQCLLDLPGSVHFDMHADNAHEVCVFALASEWVAIRFRERSLVLVIPTLTMSAFPQTFFHTVEFGTQRLAEEEILHYVERRVNRESQLRFGRGWVPLIAAWAATTMLHKSIPFGWDRPADSYFLGPEFFWDWNVVVMLMHELAPVLFALHNIVALNFTDGARKLIWDKLDKKRDMDRLRNWIGCLLGPNTMERAVDRQARGAGYLVGRYTERGTSIGRPRKGTPEAARVAERRERAVQRSQEVDEELGLHRQPVHRYSRPAVARRLANSLLSELGSTADRGVIEAMLQRAFGGGDEAVHGDVGAGASGHAQEPYRPPRGAVGVEPEGAGVAGEWGAVGSEDVGVEAGAEGIEAEGVDMGVEGVDIETESVGAGERAGEGVRRVPPPVFMMPSSAGVVHASSATAGSAPAGYVQGLFTGLSSLVSAREGVVPTREPERREPVSHPLDIASTLTTPRETEEEAGVRVSPGSAEAAAAAREASRALSREEAELSDATGLRARRALAGLSLSAPPSDTVRIPGVGSVRGPITPALRPRESGEGGQVGVW